MKPHDWIGTIIIPHLIVLKTVTRTSMRIRWACLVPPIRYAESSRNSCCCAVRPEDAGLLCEECSRGGKHLSKEGACYQKDEALSVVSDITLRIFLPV